MKERLELHKAKINILTVEINTLKNKKTCSAYKFSAVKEKLGSKNLKTMNDIQQIDKQINNPTDKKV